jgi:hypothetical protein
VTTAGGRRHAAAGALVSAAAAVAVLATPGTAAAADAKDLTPVLECVGRNGDGTYTAVFGYQNPTRTTIRVPVGSDNQVTPDSVRATVPTTFVPGDVRGAFSVTVDEDTPVKWHLGNDSVQARAGGKPSCPPTEMPAEGNGTGVVVALGAGGLFGALLLRRFRRRIAAAAAAAAAPGPSGA